MTVPHQVVVCLSAGPVAQAARAWLEDEGAAVEFDDRRSFLKITGPGPLPFELDEIGPRVGQHLSMGDFLGVMTTYVGRVIVEDRRFVVCADILDLDPPG